MYERYAGLIFDMDGTILDTEPTHRKAWREVLGHYGLQYDVQARYWGIMGYVLMNKPWSPSMAPQRGVLPSR